MEQGGVPPERIVLLGQSLGTAVASGVAEMYASSGVEFGGIVLVAGFSTLPKMLSGYKIGGVFPVFGPLAKVPFLIRLLEGMIRDKWHSVDRIERLVKLTKRRLRLSLIAGRDDPDIPCTESDKLFRAAANATMKDQLDDAAFDAWKKERTIQKRDDAFVTTLQADPNIVIRQELFPHGGEFLLLPMLFCADHHRPQ